MCPVVGTDSVHELLMLLLLLFLVHELLMLLIYVQIGE